MTAMLQAGSRIELLRPLAEGGFGQVFLGEVHGAAGFHRAVAIKRIRSRLTQSPDMVESFIREARIGGYLQHHNVVQVLGFEEIDGDYALIMELVDGVGLDRILSLARRRDAPLPLAAVAEIGAQAADGLQYIHTLHTAEGQPLQLVHRDLKPSNLLINRDGLVKISDFGVARCALGAGPGTQVGTIKGTLAYLAPEQARGERTDHRADLYSLGAILYEMLTLDPLYQDDSPFALLKELSANRVQEKLARLDRSNGAPFAPLLRQLLTRTPDERLSSAALVADSLRELEQRHASQPRAYLATFARLWTEPGAEAAHRTPVEPAMVKGGPPYIQPTGTFKQATWVLDALERAPTQVFEMDAAGAPAGAEEGAAIARSGWDDPPLGRSEWDDELDDSLNLDQHLWDDPHEGVSPGASGIHRRTARDVLAIHRDPRTSGRWIDDDTSPEDLVEPSLLGQKGYEAAGEDELEQDDLPTRVDLPAGAAGTEEATRRLETRTTDTSGASRGRDVLADIPTRIRPRGVPDLPSRGRDAGELTAPRREGPALFTRTTVSMPRPADMPSILPESTLRPFGALRTHPRSTGGGAVRSVPGAGRGVREGEPFALFAMQRSGRHKAWARWAVGVAAVLGLGWLAAGLSAPADARDSGGEPPAEPAIDARPEVGAPDIVDRQGKVAPARRTDGGGSASSPGDTADSAVAARKPAPPAPGAVKKPLDRLENAIERSIRQTRRERGLE